MNGTRYFAKRMALSIGLLALGAAMAWTFSLAMLQNAAIAAGVFPQPGAIVEAAMYKSSPFWDTAKRLQLLANTAGGAGLVLLVGYGVADHYWPDLVDEVDA